MASGPTPAPGLLVLNPGKSTEARIPLGSAEVPITSYGVTLSNGPYSQKLSITLCDLHGGFWRHIAWGTRAKFYLEGRLVFNGRLELPSLVERPGCVVASLTALGGNALLYDETIVEDYTYVYEKPNAIRKAIIDQLFVGRLTSTGIDPTAGTPVSEFTVTEGENVGDVFERLEKLDGQTFEVDETDDIRVYAPSATPQATITDDDLRGDPSDVQVDLGAARPRNIVRVQGGGGFSDRTLQEDRDSWTTLDAPAKRLAQRIKAVTARLSAVELELDRSLLSNAPGSLQLAVYKAGYNESRDAAYSTSASGGIVISNAGNANDEDDSTFAGITFTNPTPAFARFTFDLGVARTIRGAHVKHQTDGAPGGATLELQWSDDGSTWTTIDSYVETVAGTYDRIRTWAEASHRYWSLKIYESISGRTAKVYSLEFLSDRTGPRRHHPLYVDAYKVEWSDDLSISAGNVPYPPEWSDRKRYSAPKLAMTKGSAYYLVLKPPSDASGTKYWKVGYEAAADTYADGEARISTDSGATWAPLDYDITFRLFWSEDDVDITVTNTRARLTAAVDAVTTAFPVEKTDDWTNLPKTATLDTEDVAVTARSAASGPGTLTVARGANGTTPAAHASGTFLNADSVRTYGPAPHSEKDARITTQEDARAVANVILKKHAAPTTRARLPLKEFRPDLTPRAVVTWKKPGLGISGDYELAEVEHVLEEGSSTPYTILQLGAREYNAARALELVRKEASP
jgi:hypothetical protein